MREYLKNSAVSRISFADNAATTIATAVATGFFIAQNRNVYSRNLVVGAPICECACVRVCMCVSECMSARVYEFVYINCVHCIHVCCDEWVWRKAKRSRALRSRSKKGQCYKAIKYNFLCNEHSYHFCSLHLRILYILFVCTSECIVCLCVRVCVRTAPFTHPSCAFLFIHSSMMCILQVSSSISKTYAQKHYKKIKMWIETHKNTHQMFGVYVNFAPLQHYRCCHHCHCHRHHHKNIRKVFELCCDGWGRSFHEPNEFSVFIMAIIVIIICSKVSLNIAMPMRILWCIWMGKLFILMVDK